MQNMIFDHLSKHMKGVCTKEEIDLFAYSKDATQRPGNAIVVCYPENLEDLQKIIRAANRMNFSLTPRGGGTSLLGSAIPQDSVVVDLAKMNRLMEVNIEEKYVIAQPGVILEKLNAFLEKYSLEFPVKTDSARVCTIGGMISTNASSNEFDGITENWIEKIEFIDGTGKLFNKTPEDIIGSEGTLGIITSAQLKLRKINHDKSITLIKPGSVNQFVDDLNFFLKKENIISIDFYDRTASKLFELDSAFHVFVEFSDASGDISGEKYLQTLKKKKSVEEILSAKGYTYMEDVKIRKNAIIPFLAWLEKNEIPCTGHPGKGIFHPWFKKKTAYQIKFLYNEVINLNSNVIGQHGTGMLKKEFLEEDQIKKIKYLKLKYDPNNIMNRGKLI